MIMTSEAKGDRCEDRVRIRWHIASVGYYDNIVRGWKIGVFRGGVDMLSVFYGRSRDVAK